MLEDKGEWTLFKCYNNNFKYIPNHIISQTMGDMHMLQSLFISSVSFYP